MMTMATSTVDRTTSWCQSLPTTISTPSFTVQLSNVSKFDDCDKKNSCSTNLKVLREIPTRISPKTSSNDAVVVDDNDDDDRNTTTTTTLPPTMLEGTAAPLPYQLEIARITAAIERMQQRAAEKDALVDDDGADARNTTMTTTLPPTTLDRTAAPLPYQSQLAAITAAIDRWQQRDADNRLPDDGHRPEQQPTAEQHLPAEPSRVTAMEPSDPTPTATQALHDFLAQHPRTVDCTNDADGNHLHDEGRRPSSLTATIQLQTKVVRTLIVLCAELSETLDLILATVQHNNLSPSPRPPNALVTLPTSQPAHNNTDQPIPVQTALPPWLQCHKDPCNKLAPVFKSTPYKKTIPAKPPFIRSRNPVALPRTKDCMRPP